MNRTTAAEAGSVPPSGLSRGAARPLPDSVLVGLRARRPQFTGALRRVAEQVLADPAGAARATIVELAERSGTSPATVTRFCRALGFGGYADLRLVIAGETGRQVRMAGSAVDLRGQIRPSDPIEMVFEQIMSADAKAMQDTAALVDPAVIARAADLVAAARRVGVYGVGGSALVGVALQACLYRIGVSAWAWTDVHLGRASAALLRAGDVALGISHSGKSTEVVEMVSKARGQGTATIALTSFPRSPLAEVADVVLRTPTQATMFLPDALSARHPQLVVLDLLYVAVARRLRDGVPPAVRVTGDGVGGHRAAEEGADR